MALEWSITIRARRLDPNVSGTFRGPHKRRLVSACCYFRETNTRKANTTRNTAITSSTILVIVI